MKMKYKEKVEKSRHGLGEKTLYYSITVGLIWPSECSCIFLPDEGSNTPAYNTQHTTQNHRNDGIPLTFGKEWRRQQKKKSKD